MLQMLCRRMYNSNCTCTGVPSMWACVSLACTGNCVLLPVLALVGPSCTLQFLGLLRHCLAALQRMLGLHQPSSFASPNKQHMA
jgi:hypothetical protein